MISKDKFCCLICANYNREENKCRMTGDTDIAWRAHRTCCGREDWHIRTTDSVRILLEFCTEDEELLDKGLGFALILKYEPTAEFRAGYDALWVGDYYKTYELMTPEERSLMESLNWVEDEGAWCILT